jgi:hypothetical protein
MAGASNKITQRRTYWGMSFAGVGEAAFGVEMFISEAKPNKGTSTTPLPKKQH